MKFTVKDFIPPFFDKISRKMERMHSGIEYPFYNCVMERDIKVIFDIGANIGDVTLVAARSYPKAHIHAFEPVKSTYEILCENTKAYANRITNHNFGFFNVSKKIEINITTFHGANSIIKQSEKYKTLHPDIKECSSESIQLFTMDEFVEREGIDKIDIVKIDVEGVEKDVIQGGLNTLRNKVENVFIELSFTRNIDFNSPIEILKTLSDLGFILINFYEINRFQKNDKICLSQIDAFLSKNPTLIK